MTEVTYLPGMTDIPTTLRRLSEEDIEQALIMFVQDGKLFAYKINVSPQEAVYFAEYLKMNELVGGEDD